MCVFVYACVCVYYVCMFVCMCVCICGNHMSSNNGIDVGTTALS